MSKIFFTGFPGFLGSELLPRVLLRASEDTAVCLVQGKFMDLARQRADEVTHGHPELKSRIELVEGDITNLRGSNAPPEGDDADGRRRASQVDTVNDDNRCSGLIEKGGSLLDLTPGSGIVRIKDGHGPSGSGLRAGRKHVGSSKTTPEKLCGAKDWVG